MSARRSAPALARRGASFPVLPWLLISLPALGMSACTPTSPHVGRALMADRGTAVRNEGVAETYAVGCPDVLEVTAAGRRDLPGRCPIGPDGRIDLGPVGSVRVEGRTPTAAAARVARLLGLPPGQVRVRVVEYNSQEVYLAGPGFGVPRAVPYRGQETVLDLLQRAGGVTPAAAPEDVYVVRPHVTEGERPEVFHIDLRAIAVKKDQHTNLRLQPFDQVYVGETRQGKLDKCLPPWLRPVYQLIWGIKSHEPGAGPNPVRREESASLTVPAAASPPPLPERAGRLEPGS